MATLLLIDDDESLRRVTEFQLQQAGYQVIACGSGAEGLELFRRQQPDLVITDVQMPGVSGEEVLVKVLAEKPAALVIVITAHGTVEKAVSAMKTGAFDYLTKPFSREAICFAVEKALDYGRLSEENRELKQRLAARHDFSRVVGISKAMTEVFATVSKVAASEATVLIGGESGTGKELIARELHDGSERRDGAFCSG